MKFKYLSLLALCGAVLSTPNARGDAIWTGAVDNDFWNAGNWSGTAPSPSPATYAGNVIINNAVNPITGAGTLILADGSSLAITNSTLTLGAINGVVGGSVNNVSIHGSSVTCSSVAIGIAVKLTGNAPTSVLTLTGAGRMISSQAETSSVTLAVGSRIVSSGGNNDPAGSGSPTPPDRSNGLSIFHELTGQSYAADTLNAPQTDFHVSGADLTPFGPLGGGNGANGGTFTIRAKVPPNAYVPYDLLVGFRGPASYPDSGGGNGLWYPTLRSPTDWQINLDFSMLLGYPNPWGWSGIVQDYLADLNGDGISDKIMHQAAGTPAQVIATYSGPPPSGFLANNFFAPYGDLQIPWTFLDQSQSTLVFGDIDGDGIDDCGVNFDASLVGGTAGQLVWGAFKSEGIIGISVDHGGFANFIGWSAFGSTTNGDIGMLGDFNGDGIADRLLYRVPSLQAYIDYSNPAGGWGDGVADVTLPIGITGDKLTVSDINGDGLDDLVIYGRDIGGGLQGLYGYYNDGNNFASFNGASPNIQDIWGIESGVLFGQLGQILAPVPQPNLASPSFVSGPPNEFQFSWNSVAGVNYYVDSTPSLAPASWTQIGWATGTGSSVTFTNTPAPVGPVFYRVRVP